MKMKVLIADDNITLQEILTEIVHDAGHTAETASAADAALSAMDSFHPDVILLDIDMPDGLELLDRMQNSAPPIDIPVVIIRSWGRQIPQDISMVKCHIEKPFTTMDVLESINATQAKEAEAGVQPVAAAKHAEPHQNAPQATLSEMGVLYGTSYVSFRHNPNAINNLITTFAKGGFDVLVISTKKKKTIVERFGSNKIKSLTMTIKLFGGHFNIYGLGTMIDDADEFIKSSGKPVVAFDDLNKLIDRNGMNSALTAVHQLISKKYDKEVTFLVSVDPAGFTVKDKEILLNHMAYYDPVGE